MPDTLSEQAHKHTIASVRTEAPARFAVGATADILAGKVEAKATIDRRWANGLGLTGYLKAWWNDQAVIPTDKRGAVIGIEADYHFPPR